MGLIENVRVQERAVQIDMLLTTGWCPFVANLNTIMEERVKEFTAAESVTIQVLWDPVWTMERLSESARAKLVLPMEELLPLREKRLAEQQGG
jgi:metal-sulfur cluster biosynthetic enzyme